MGKTKIFINYHKPYDLLKSDILVPLHAGRAIASVPAKDRSVYSSDDLEWLINNTVGDDTGDNISSKNRNYNELTGIYWAWKNYEAIGNPDHVGFMQYRRHFIFNESKFKGHQPANVDEKSYSKINVGYIHDSYVSDYGLDDKTIKNYTAKYDCILPKNCELSDYVDSIENDFTERIEGTKKEDLEILKNSVAKVAPEYYETLLSRLKSTDKRCYQSFILKKELFFDYCEFLFGILNEVETKLDTTGYSVNGQRTLGYLGEILFDTYFHDFETRTNVKVKELGTTYICTNSIFKPVMPKTAIVLLAFSDFESLELSLAVYSKFLPKNSKLYVLQNGRGTYDTERTYRVGKRYADLFPGRIEVVDDIPPQKPYWAIRQLLESHRMNDFDYICKVDDDAFPLTSDWLEKLCSFYEQEYATHGDNLAYVSTLVNNNPFGFKQLIERNEILSKEYFSKIARDHLSGVRGKREGYAKETFHHADEIDDGVNGTIWGYPYIARWLHENTTLQPDRYIKMVSGYPDVYAGTKRYSINCMLFAKHYWTDIEDMTSDSPDDDEYLSEQYCKKNGKLVGVRLSVPFVHLYFFAQREENRDMIVDLRAIYSKWLDLAFPIGLQDNKDFENENRLRFIEAQLYQRVPEPVNAIHKRIARRAWHRLPAKAKPPIKRVYKRIRT